HAGWLWSRPQLFYLQLQTMRTMMPMTMTQYTTRMTKKRTRTTRRCRRRAAAAACSDGRRPACELTADRCIQPNAHMHRCQHWCSHVRFLVLGTVKLESGVNGERANLQMVAPYFRFSNSRPRMIADDNDNETRRLQRPPSSSDIGSIRGRSTMSSLGGEADVLDPSMRRLESPALGT
ncbi:hypothetical protein evm_015550, partial [Chilo suppressalis]